jgi:hypothetical protein
MLYTLKSKCVVLLWNLLYIPFYMENVLLFNTGSLWSAIRKQSGVLKSGNFQNLSTLSVGEGQSCTMATSRVSLKLTKARERPTVTAVTLTLASS